MAMTNKKPVEYTSLKKRLMKIGVPIPGTIHALYARCGSPTCPCATDNTKRHGPYYRWHYREGKRSIVQGITVEELQQFAEWIENRDKIYLVVDEMLKIGARLATEKLNGQNPKKTNPPMRGK
jgi:hypothetical protein